MATFNEISGLQLRSLCNALGLQRSYPEYLLLQRFLFEPWGELEIPARPRFRSLIGDDHSPYEYSVAFNADGAELRLLLEAQAPRPSRLANYEAALQLTRRLADVFPLDLQRFHAIADLLLPNDAQGQFSLWHAVSLHPDRPPSFKVYLNPQIAGRHRADGLVQKACERLGLGDAIPRLLEGLASRGDDLDDLSYFSLDLADRPDARVKVYFTHHGATADELESICALSPTHRHGDVSAFCRDMVGDQGPFIRKPVSTCFSFVGGLAVPSAVTLHLPIAHYAVSDQAVAARVDQYLTKHGENAETYREIIRTFPSRSLAGGTGVQSYTSFRREASGMRLTVYLSPGLYHHDTGRLELPRNGYTSAGAVART